MSQFSGQDQWGQWSPIPEGMDPCIYAFHPDCLAKQSADGVQPQDTKLAALKYKHETQFLLFLLAVVISIYVYNNR